MINRKLIHDFYGLTNEQHRTSGEMRLSKFYITLFILFMISGTGFTQDLQFSEAPENYRLYARGESDSATVSFTGKVDSRVDVERLSLQVFKDDKPYGQQEITVVNKQFSISSRINAGLHQFRFELYTNKGGGGQSLYDS